ncbi:transcriptional regulator [Burkholderia pseudomallei]|uniref:MmyB family transcriptional regulator n=1 Tax=Burkholderia pseudomallei TaxID=28450 RepID=UPI001FCA78AC|nr:transcriptional regulator [Burkholderia pseudomallei]
MSARRMRRSMRLRGRQLDKIEAAHLRAPARRGATRAFVRERVPPAIARLVAHLDQPAYVTGRRWDLLAWNAAAADLLGFDRLAEADRNILIYMFVEPEARRLFAASWADEARRMIALFRASHDLYADDPAFVALVERLRASSDAFATGWDAHDVRGGMSGQKVFAHARRGTQRYEYATFQANDDLALKLAIYTPVSVDV